MTGYSDRINHALAFAAKHHDQQVRGGLRSPYLTRPANVAIILTRYGQDDDTVIAGILLNVARDYVNAAHGPELLRQRIGEKFGERVLDMLLEAAPRRSERAGVQLSDQGERVDLLRRLRESSAEARWVIAADALHDVASMLADLRRTIDRSVVWARSGQGVEWYRELAAALRDSGFRGAILDELGMAVEELEGQR